MSQCVCLHILTYFCHQVVLHSAHERDQEQGGAGVQPGQVVGDRGVRRDEELGHRRDVQSGNQRVEVRGLDGIS